MPWIERLFDRLSGFYGSKFGEMWRGCDIESVKQTWAEALAGYTPEEIRAGLDACLSRIFPPTLPEFRMLCRKPIDFEATFYEACEQLQKRESNQDKWSHPSVYWAAVSIGNFDMRNSTWGHIRERWIRALNIELDKGQWPDVPERLEALPAPGKTFTNPEVAKARLEAIKKQFPVKIVKP